MAEQRKNIGLWIILTNKQAIIRKLATMVGHFFTWPWDFEPWKCLYRWTSLFFFPSEMRVFSSDLSIGLFFCSYMWSNSWTQFYLILLLNPVWCELIVELGNIKNLPRNVLICLFVFFASFFVCLFSLFVCLFSFFLSSVYSCSVLLSRNWYEQGAT